jgi:hypothetical protein
MYCELSRRVCVHGTWYMVAVLLRVLNFYVGVGVLDGQGERKHAAVTAWRRTPWYSCFQSTMNFSKDDEATLRAGTVLSCHDRQRITTKG